MLLLLLAFSSSAAAAAKEIQWRFGGFYWHPEHKSVYYRLPCSRPCSREQSLPGVRHPPSLFLTILPLPPPQSSFLVSVSTSFLLLPLAHCLRPSKVRSVANRRHRRPSYELRRAVAADRVRWDPARTLLRQRSVKDRRAECSSAEYRRSRTCRRL